MEMLLAAALFALVAASSVSVFSMGLQIWKRAKTLSSTDRKAQLALVKLTRDLHNAIHITPQPAAQFSIRKKMFEYKGSAGEIMIPAGGNGRMTYQWDSSTKELCQRFETASDLFQNRHPECKVLAKNIIRFRARYWLPSGLEDSYSWYDDWDGKDGLPYAIEVEMELKPENEQANRKVYKKTIMIPAGGKDE